MLTTIQVKGSNTWYHLNHCTKSPVRKEEPGRRQAGARQETKRRCIEEQLSTANRHSLLNIQSPGMRRSDMPVAPDDIPTLADTPDRGVVQGDGETTTGEWKGDFLINFSVLTWSF